MESIDDNAKRVRERHESLNTAATSTAVVSSRTISLLNLNESPIVKMVKKNTIFFFVSFI